MHQHTRRPGNPRALVELARALSPSLLRGAVPERTVTGLAADSREVEPGDLFIATRGGQVDGHRFLADAAARGAVAAVVEQVLAEPPLPLLVVRDGRRALAELAAAWHGHPARRVPLVGITGTMGKTSTLAFLETILRAAERRAGSVGSLGIRLDGCSLRETGYTVPGPIQLHESLQELNGRGCGVVVMEATTHAMMQERLHGIRFDLGVFTGLVPLEHSEYHPSFRDYARAKLRFFRHLAPGAPLVYLADSPVLEGVLRGRDVLPIPCGTAEGARVRLQIESVGVSGTAIRLVSPQGVPGLDGAAGTPFEVRLRLPLAGRSAAINALLAAATAACLGVGADTIRDALGGIESAPRRMQIVQTAPFLILDDYGGHPDTVSAVSEVVGALRWRGLHVLTGYRGSRGPRINLAMARALAVWLGHTPHRTLCLTAAAETSDERSRALPEEREAFQGALRHAGVPFHAEDRLDDALARVMPRVREGDLLVILGTQGMDGAAGRARRWWAEHRRGGGRVSPARRP
jgi:UDP-N-acetylmuramoyl-L-alanyl-D-glutamate--2,6-diaminopimelate ligase